MKFGRVLRLAVSTLAKGQGDGLNPMHRFIRDKIRSGGPITVHEYMQLSVSSPGGYYSQDVDQRPLFGEKGDFVTAPEITQIFGELLGVWVANELAHTGHRGEWQLVELGPGSGALMKDMLRTLQRLNGQVGKFSAHLVETSDSLTSLQRTELASTAPQGIRLHWHKSLADVPEKFSVFVANEFFDALPIHQFQRDEQSGAWHEVYVNLEGNGQQPSSSSPPTATDKLCFMLSRGENLHTKGLIPPSIREDPTKTHWEICPLAGEYAGRMAEKFTHNGGFGLIVDYGHDGERRTHSLRAYKRHGLADPLEAPGEIDLTADVDFGFLRKALVGECLLFGPVNQRNFLSELGLSHRVDYLLRQCKDAKEREYVIRSLKMLIGGDAEGGMGTRFKAMGLFPTTLAGLIDRRGGVPTGFQSSLSSTQPRPASTTMSN